jgi:hypothetical protein
LSKTSKAGPAQHSKPLGAQLSLLQEQVWKLMNRFGSYKNWLGPMNKFVIYRTYFSSLGDLGASEQVRELQEQI